MNLFSAKRCCSVILDYQGESDLYHFAQKMSNKEELVFINCIHEGCKSQRMFMKRPNEKLPEYVCTKHRRLYFLFQMIYSVVIVLLLKYRIE